MLQCVCQCTQQHFKFSKISWSYTPEPPSQARAPAFPLFLLYEMTDELQCLADFEARRRQLHSTSSSSLTVRRTRLSTVGDRAFPVAATRTWNSLPQHVTSAPSMSVSKDA